MQTSTQAVRARTDEPFLERFIEAHEAFVLRARARHAGFAVTRSDDEYSVALLAFYEAIKGYDPASEPFGAYASLVIGDALPTITAVSTGLTRKRRLPRRRSTARWTARARTPPCSRRSRSR